MAKMIKIFGSIIGIIILIIIAAAIIITTLVNPNDFKQEISQYVKQETGRQLVINGKISWSFFPWIGLKVTDATLNSGASFPNTPFLSINEADFKIKAMPLLQGKVVMNHIILKNLDVNLVKNSDDKANWELKQTDNSIEVNQANNTTTTNTSKQKTTKTVGINIASIKISNATLSYTDLATGQKYTINNLDLNSNKVNFGQPFPISITADLTNKPAIDANIVAKTDITISPNQQKYNLENIDLTYTDKQAGNNKYQLQGAAAIDLKQGTFNAIGLTLKHGELVANANITGEAITQTPLFKGTIQILPFNPKTLLAKQGSPIHTENPNALTKLSATMNFAASPKYIKLNDIKAKLDKSTITGKFSIADFNQNNISFNLAVDQLDLNNYQLKPTAEKQPEKSNNQTATTTTVSNNKSSQKTTQQNAVKTNIAITGNITINDLTVDKLKFKNVTAPIQMRHNIITIDPFTAKLYSGTSEGKIVANFSQTTPSYQILEKINHVQLQPLLKDLANNSKISGTGYLTLNINTRGNSPTELKRALQGQINFDVKNGVYSGMDIDYQLMRAYSFLKRKNEVADDKDDKRTEFRKLSGSATIKNGVAYSNDILLQSHSFQVKGQGNANLNNQKLDFSLNARGIRDTDSTTGRSLEERQTIIPLILVGTFDSPKLLPDFKALAKVILQEEVKNRSGGAIGTALEKAGINKELGDKIKNALPLDRLFGN